MNFEQHPYLDLNITFVCKRVFHCKLEYIRGNLLLTLCYLLGNVIASRSSYTFIKVQYVRPNGCPNFWDNIREFGK